MRSLVSCKKCSEQKAIFGPRGWRRGYPSNLDRLPIYVLFDRLINLPFEREKFARGV
jgi:hypothetical protein